MDPNIEWTSAPRLCAALIEHLAIPPEPIEAEPGEPPRQLARRQRTQAHERLKILSVILALDDPDDPQLDPACWLDQAPSPLQRGCLRLLVERGARPEAQRLWASLARWRDHGADPAAIAAHLQLLERVAGPDAAEALIAGLSPHQRAGLLIYTTLPEPLEARVWAQHTADPPDALAPATELAVAYATLERPTSRERILSGPEPLDAHRLAQGLEGWPTAAIPRLFEGHPRRWREACDRLLLPCELLIPDLDPAGWRTTLQDAMAQQREHDARQQATAQLRRRTLQRCPLEVGDVVQLRVHARIKGGLSAVVALPHPDDPGALVAITAFLPGSQLSPTPDRGALEEAIGHQLQARVIKLNRRRGVLVVSPRALIEAGATPSLDPERSAWLSDPAHLVGLPPSGRWAPPCSRERAAALIFSWDALSDLRAEAVLTWGWGRVLSRWLEQDEATALAWAMDRPLEEAGRLLGCLHPAHTERLSAARGWLEAVLQHAPDPIHRTSALRLLVCLDPESISDRALRAWSRSPELGLLSGEARLQLAARGHGGALADALQGWPELSWGQRRRAVQLLVPHDPPQAVERFGALVEGWQLQPRPGARFAPTLGDVAETLVQAGGPLARTAVLRAALRLGTQELGDALALARDATS